MDYLHFWAKTNRDKSPGLDENWIHPLWAHLIDVANAALTLYLHYLPIGLKEKMAASLNMSINDTGRFLSIWIGLHDLGKAIPGFQVLHQHSKEKLINRGFYFPDQPERVHHGHASIAIMLNWLNSKDIKNTSLMEAISAFVGIHHGILCRTESWENMIEKESSDAPLGDPKWRENQLLLIDHLLDAWDTPMPDFDNLPVVDFPKKWPEWLMAFAGWATLADWLGSMQNYFPSDAFKNYEH